MTNNHPTLLKEDEWVKEKNIVIILLYAIKNMINTERTCVFT